MGSPAVREFSVDRFPQQTNALLTGTAGLGTILTESQEKFVIRLFTDNVFLMQCRQQLCGPSALE